MKTQVFHAEPSEMPDFEKCGEKCVKEKNPFSCMCCEKMPFGQYLSPGLSTLREFEVDGIFKAWFQTPAYDWDYLAIADSKVEARLALEAKVNEVGEQDDILSQIINKLIGRKQWAKGTTDRRRKSMA